MAKYEVNFSCGHTEKRELFGKVKSRLERIEWLEKGVCKKCWQEEKALERAKELEVAKKQAQESGLPELIGSEKQVAWAETIRKNALSSPQNTVASETDFNNLPEENKNIGVYNILKEARKRLETETSAKWWIENRDDVNRYCFLCGDNYCTLNNIE